MKNISLISFLFIFTTLSCSHFNWRKNNNIPEVTNECGGDAYEDQLYSCKVEATDRDLSLNWMSTDDEVLQYSLIESPDGMIIDSITGEISWTPVDSQADKSNHIKIAVSDIIGATVFSEFDIFVNRANDPHIYTTI